MSDEGAIELLREASGFVALVGLDDRFDPRVSASARRLLCKLYSLPEMAIKEGLMQAEGGPPPVQAGGSLQEFQI